jgi:hypothetical protein
MVDIDPEQPDPGRRALLKGATVSAVLLPTLNMSPAAQAASRKVPSSEPPQASVDLMINGRRERLTLDTRTTLLDPCGITSAPTVRRRAATRRPRIR